MWGLLVVQWRPRSRGSVSRRWLRCLCFLIGDKQVECDVPGKNHYCDAFGIHVILAIPFFLVLFRPLTSCCPVLRQLECAHLGSMPGCRLPWGPLAIAPASHVNDKKRDYDPAFQITGFTGIIEAPCSLGMPIISGVGVEVWRLSGTERGQKEAGRVLIKNPEAQVCEAQVQLCL